jgi:carbamoyl-phosphate synthase large subunit
MTQIHKILTEASGSLTSGYLFKAIKDANAHSVGSDINPLTCAVCLADEFIQMPEINDSLLWSKVTEMVLRHRINVVIPSLDEMMLGWVEHSDFLALNGCKVIISPKESIEICQDKWKTYQFFKNISIPTPQTSLDQIYPLVKPRFGRGGQGVRVCENRVDMKNMISQQLMLGEELTIDVFFDRDGSPVYIVPRKRLKIVNGKSTQGEVIFNKEIVNYVELIAKKMRFIGPINIQCFICPDGIYFIEINPRIAGGMALGFAATENWINLIIDNIILGNKISPKPIKYGMKMTRYYAECFTVF